MAISQDKTRVIISITKELNKEVEELAKKEERNKSQMISVLLKKALADYKNK